MTRGSLRRPLRAPRIAALALVLTGCSGEEGGSESGGSTTKSGEATSSEATSSGSSSSAGSSGEATGSGSGGDASGSTGSATSGGTGDTGDTGDTGVDRCDQGPPDPVACDADAKGELYCTSTDKACPGSLHECGAGGWELLDLDATCAMLGHDFAFGCVDDAGVGGILTVCGNGPGTPCDADTPPACMGLGTLLTCSLGKTSATDCLASCQAMGDDHGECQSEDGAAECLCCSKGDVGCPV